MELPVLDTILSQLRYKLENDDLVGARMLLESLRSPDQANVIAELDEEEQIELIPQLDPTVSADIFEEMDEGDAADLAEILPAETLIRIVDEMEPDEAADLLGDLSEAQMREVLAGLDDPEEIRPLLLHPDESAGGLMTSEFLALREKMTVREALDAFHAWKPDTENVYYLYVVDAQGRLCGLVNLRQLIIADPATHIADILDRDVISVEVGTDQEKVAHLMTHYSLATLPVIDNTRHLLGVVMVDDMVDVLVAEATEDIQRMGGAEPLERAYLSTSVAMVTQKRIRWLFLLFITESLTGTVLRLFEHELEVVVALSFFIPLLIGTGGNAGSQTTSTIIRALAVGEISTRDALHTLWHEIRVGVLLGLGLAVVAYIRALTWGTSSDLALTVSLAIFSIVLWANALGALLPMLAIKLKVDPTLVSGPMMSTLVDATGLFIYFSIAKIVLGL